MIGKMSRKGKNPGAVDSWLDSLGYYRKNVAYDETCLFRAVSEQMYCCQIYHERIRKECVDYGIKHFDEFAHLVCDENAFMSHLDKLSKHMAVCGLLEMHLISKKYRKNILLFDSMQRRVVDVSQNDYDDTLLLCLMLEDHFDVVYKKEVINTAGFCQSIVYNILYERLFRIDQVDDIVKAMLYDKSPYLSGHTYVSEDLSFTKKKDGEFEFAANLKASAKPENANDYDYMLQTNLAPFPFKVAKALDPNIYRNIEYDTWTEMRKEMKLGDWYYGDNKLILGTKCQLNDNGDILQCYIQEILKDTNQCVVFITSRAEKRTVDYDDLKPESDAKPWPLPYRFSKNLLILPPMETNEKENKIIKKRRDKKNGNMKSQPQKLKLEISSKVHNYEGCPLQMQPIENLNDKMPIQMDTSDSIVPNDPAIIQWTGPWDPNASQTPVMWTQTPVTPVTPQMFTYPVKSIPATPDTPYTTTESFVYYENNNYTTWSSTQTDYTQTQQQIQPPTTPQNIENTPIQMTPDVNCNYFYYPEIFSPQNMSPQVCVPLTPSTGVEMYYNQPPTPLIYAPREGNEVILPQTPNFPLYTPPPTFEYISTPICMVPSTPNANWYNPNVNSHGFIFPAPNNVQNIPSHL